MKPKVYDLTYLRELSSGDQDFENSMIEYFIENSPTVISTMDQLVAEEDWAECREVIHKFIPNLNMVGAHELLQNANNVEIFTEKRINLDQVSGLWGKVKSGCVKLIEQMKSDFQK